MAANHLTISQTESSVSARREFAMLPDWPAAAWRVWRRRSDFGDRPFGNPFLRSWIKVHFKHSDRQRPRCRPTTTFVAADHRIASIQHDLQTAGNWSLTVTDVANAALTGTQTTLPCRREPRLTESK